MLLFIGILEAMGEDDTKMHSTAKLAFSNNTGEVSTRKAAESSQINVLSKHVKAAGGYPYWEGDIAPRDFTVTQLYLMTSHRQQRGRVTDCGALFPQSIK